MSSDTLSLSTQGSHTVSSQQHQFRQGELIFFIYIFFYIYSIQRGSSNNDLSLELSTGVVDWLGADLWPHWHVRFGATSLR